MSMANSITIISTHVKFLFLNQSFVCCTSLTVCSWLDATPPADTSRLRHASSVVLSAECRPHSSDRTSACINEVLSWVKSNRLSSGAILVDASPNPDHASKRNAPLMCSRGFFRYDVGVQVDSVTLRTHITATVGSCFASLQQVRSQT